jgi:hypothetical protein
MASFIDEEAELDGPDAAEDLDIEETQEDRDFIDDSPIADEQEVYRDADKQEAYNREFDNEYSSIPGECRGHIFVNMIICYFHRIIGLL